MDRKPKLYPLLLVSLMILPAGACRKSSEKHDPLPADSLSVGNARARNFSMVQGSDGTKILTVRSPWQQSGSTSFRYVLYDRTAGAEGKGGHNDQGSKETASSGRQAEYGPDRSLRIGVPVRRVVVTSTTHLAYLCELGCSGSVVGISGTKYVYDRDTRRRIREGRIREIGHDQSLNYELILALHPDVVFMYGVTGNVSNHISRFADMGIPVVMVSEYLERHPLGKAEWIRFFAAFYGMGPEADSIFNRTRKYYEVLSGMTVNAGKRPSVLSGLPWKDAWWVPGGRSFAASFIEDAGGDYLWKGNDSYEAIPLDLEAVYGKARDADVWINPGSAASTGEIIAMDSRLGSIGALSEGRVYNNDARLSPDGGNDYWESGVCHPERILADLIRIFHPNLLPDRRFVYYRKLTKGPPSR